MKIFSWDNQGPQGRPQEGKGEEEGGGGEGEGGGRGEGGGQGVKEALLEVKNYLLDSGRPKF